MTDLNTKLPLRLELFWWLFTAVVAIGVIYPIISSLNNFPFLFLNILYIVTFITVTRYLFLLKHTFLARSQAAKLVIIFLTLPFVFYLVQELNLFQTFLDNNGDDALVKELPFNERVGLARYIHSEMLLFGVGSIISTVILPFRLVLSIWRVRNRGTY